MIVFWYRKPGDGKVGVLSHRNRCSSQICILKVIGGNSGRGVTPDTSSSIGYSFRCERPHCSTTHQVLSRKFWTGEIFGPGDQNSWKTGPSGPFSPENSGPPLKKMVRLLIAMLYSAKIVCSQRMVKGKYLTRAVSFLDCGDSIGS